MILHVYNFSHPLSPKVKEQVCQQKKFVSVSEAMIPCQFDLTRSIFVQVKVLVDLHLPDRFYNNDCIVPPALGIAAYYLGEILRNRDRTPRVLWLRKDDSLLTVTRFVLGGLE